MLIAAAAPGQTQPQTDPAYQTLAKAFDALRAKDYDTAIAGFRKAAAISPGRPDIRKNLAYTLLKTGDSDAAREEFGEATRLDPSDEHVALEYAFLCYEARENAPARKAEARRIFARIRDTGDPETRATAARAFQNVDAPLESGIARWQSVLATTTPTFSAHYELAQLAEERDLDDLAAAHYRAAFALLPERKSVLLELARAEKARGNTEGMMAALIAASRGGEPRAAELAREQLPERYPYVYEFRKALELDPASAALHRELAFLLLSMSEKDPPARTEAVQEFRAIVEKSPDDYLAAAQLGLLYLADNQTDLAMPILRNVLARADAATANRVRVALKMPLVLEERHAQDTESDPRILGERSYQAGFLKDAKRYLLQAHEQNPVDPEVDLKLGWTNNLLHDDATALRWFGLARQSSDSAIAAEADRAYGNLRSGVEFLRTTVWFYPLYSSRWNDLFGYGQAKTEFRQKKLPLLHPYLSVRLAGDARRYTGGADPQSLSESAFIFAAGVATSSWHGATGWFEAGAMVSYLNLNRFSDYRGGISFTRTRGASLAAEAPGAFLETTDDGVFVSHFQNDLLLYSQNRAGYTFLAGPVRVQPYWGNDFTVDVQRQYWANSFETGPGVRFRHSAMPPPMWLNLSFMRGIYLVNAGNPGRPDFNEFRAGAWYAFTK